MNEHDEPGHRGGGRPMSERAYMSIGDVLALLRREFPDVTISKIRFLESQGLVDPERTPSGYRKFYDHDVERLRWVLRQQREHFLPLKVIKGRLEEGSPARVPNGSDVEEPSLGHGAHPSQGPSGTLMPRGRVPLEREAREARGGGRPLFLHPPSVPAGRTSYPEASGTQGSGTHTGRQTAATGQSAQSGESALRTAAGTLAGSGAPVGGPDAEDFPAGQLGVPTSRRTTPLREAGTEPSRGRSPDAGARLDPTELSRRQGSASELERAAERGGSRPRVEDGAESSAARAAQRGEDRREIERRDLSTGEDTPRERPEVSSMAGPGLTVDELAEECGLEVSDVTELESFGLLGGRTVGGTVYYDAGAVAVAKLASSFAAFGVEARHLRMHLLAAQREAGFTERVVLPLLKQRNPASRQRAHDTVVELSRLGQELHSVLLQRSIRELLGG